MKLDIYQVDAFTDYVFGGNPAAVVPLETWLEDRVLQQIAAENNLSETAFFVPKDDGFELRWFTPLAEVELCGHATLAASYVIFNELAYAKDEISFESRERGILKVKKDGNLIQLNFPGEEAVPCDIPEGLLEALSLHRASAFKGLTDYLIVIDSEQELAHLTVDFAAIKQLDVRGVIVSAPGKSVDFVSRFFAPAVGIDEDPVTGSAHCLMAPYWSEKLGKNKLKAKQISNRIGDLLCEVEQGRVKISGEAQLYLKGEIRF